MKKTVFPVIIPHAVHFQQFARANKKLLNLNVSVQTIQVEVSKKFRLNLLRDNQT